VVREVERLAITVVPQDTLPENARARARAKVKARTLLKVAILEKEHKDMVGMLDKEIIKAAVEKVQAEVKVHISTATVLDVANTATELRIVGRGLHMKYLMKTRTPEMRPAWKWTGKSLESTWRRTTRIGRR